MAEQNEAKKKPPLIPPNFVTLAQLKERYFKEQEQERQEREREQREREEQEKLKRQEEEEEKQARSKRGEGEPVKRGNGRPWGRNDRRYRRREIEESEERGSRIWKRKGEKSDEVRANDEVIKGEGSRKPDELEVATAASENAVEEAREGFENKRKGFKTRNKKGKRKDKARAQDDEVIGGEEQALPPQGVDRKSMPARRKPLPRGNPRHSRSRMEDESEGQSVEKFGGEELIGGEKQALPSHGVDKEIIPARRKPLPRRSRSRIGDESKGQSVEISEKLGGEEVITGEEQSLPSQGVFKEINSARRKPLPRGTPRHSRSRIEDESMEISEKFEGLSINGGNRREHRVSRGYSDRSNLTYRRGYGRFSGFRRPREMRMRDSGMMWVKKGEDGDGNAGEIQ